MNKRGLILTVIVALVLLQSVAIILQQPADVAVGVQAAPRMMTEQIVVNAYSASYGQASGSKATSKIYNAELLDVYVDYRAAISTTTDITLAYTSPAWGNILVKADSATDTLYHPRIAPVNSSASAFTNEAVRYILDGTLTASVGQSTTFSPCVTITLHYVSP